MSNTYHFIGIKGAGMSALALMLHQMGHTVQGSDVEKYYFTQRGLEQAGIQIYPFDVKNLEGDKILIAGNAFRPDNNVEIAYADEHGLTYKRYHEFLGEFMRDFVSMGVAGAHGKTSTTGMLSHVLSNITDTSYLIGDGTGRGSAAAKYFVFESDEYERHFMPYHLNSASSPILTLTIQTISRAWKMSLMPLTIMPNKSAKASSSTEKTKNCVGLPHQHQFITMVLIRRRTIFVASNLLRSTTGSTFNVHFRGEDLGQFHIPTFGRHNIMKPQLSLACFSPF